MDTDEQAMADTDIMNKQTGKGHSTYTHLALEQNKLYHMMQTLIIQILTTWFSRQR